jgi:hypothetical protein
MALEMSGSIQAAEGPRLSNYYLRSPFGSRYFVLPSLLGLLDVGLIAITCVRRWEFLPARSILALALAACGIVMVLLMAIRTQRTVNRYLKTAQIEKLEPGSPLETGLYVAAYVTYYGFLWTFAAVTLCLGALGEAFIR